MLASAYIQIDLRMIFIVSSQTNQIQAELKNNDLFNFILFAHEKFAM